MTSQTQPAAQSVSQASVTKLSSSSRGGISKKPRNKIANKSKIIKFHEYHGPPGAQRNNQNELQSNMGNSAAAVSYSIMVQQQQMLLQWQLQQQQQQNRSIVLSVSQSGAGPAPSQSSSLTSSAASPSASAIADVKLASASPASAAAASAPPNRPTRLEDMKVADLKEACRRLNLSRSGPKPVLIERLQPHACEILGQAPVGSSSAVEQPMAGDRSGLGVVQTEVNAQPMVPMEVDGACKSEPTTPVTASLTFTAQYSSVSACPAPAVTALQNVQGSQSNVALGSACIAMPTAHSMHSFAVLPARVTQQHMSVMSATPSGAQLPKVVLPTVNVVPSNAPNCQQVQGPGTHIIRGTLQPSTDAKVADNANTPLHRLPAMPQMPVIFVRPDAAVHGVSSNGAGPCRPVGARLPVSIASAVHAPNSISVTSSGVSTVAPVFVFQTAPVLPAAAAANEQVRNEAVAASEKLPLSPEELVIRQRQHIMQLERHLRLSQQELARAQQEARLRQLTSLDEASRSTSLFWPRPLGASASVPLTNVAVSMCSPNAIRIPAVASTIASSLNRLLAKEYYLISM